MSERKGSKEMEGLMKVLGAWCSGAKQGCVAACLGKNGGFRDKALKSK